MITARALSYQLAELRKSIGGPVGKIAAGKRITVRSIDRRYICRDPMTGLLTQGSAQKIKRAVSNAFKNSVGKDALFMFVIEQQDKDGNPCDPHIHAMANIPFKLGSIPELKRRLQRIAGNDDEGTVKIQTLSQMGQHHNEIAPGEANYRRGAQYDAKNDHTIFYRSRPLMAHVHKHFEELKEHYSQEP